MKVTATVMAIGAMGFFGSACSKKSSTTSSSPSPDASGTASTTTSTTIVSLPLVTPTVKAATPAGFLKGSASLSLTGSGANAGLSLLDGAPYAASDITSRFFSDGPTYIFSILGNIDSFITGVTQAQPSCMIGAAAATPVPYTIKAFGQTLNFSAQCYTVGTPTASDPQLQLVGMSADATTMYFYSANGAERIAAMVSPTTPNTKIADATAGTSLHIQAWIGVGYTNAGACPNASGTWDSCSYGVIQLDAIAAMPSASNASGSATTSEASTPPVFEMSVAGLGFGFCGIQLKSDGTNLYTDGSADMGTCQTAASLCVLDSDLVTAGNCTNISTFTLPALGRTQSPSSLTSIRAGAPWGASTYPAVPTITLNGSTSDSLWFGPITAPAGTTKFIMGGSNSSGSGGNSSGTGGNSSGTGGNSSGS